MRLHQIIALSKTAHSEGEGALTKAYHQVEKSSALVGVSKVYKPRDEEGERLPSEGNKLQLRVPEIMSDTVGPLTRFFDLALTSDVGNQAAVANIVVDGRTIAQEVPVTFLLFLEKKLAVFAEFIKKLPVLDPAETWEEGDDGVSFKTVPSDKVRTKKVPRNHVKAEATDKHPAQVELYYEDIVVGDWTTVNFSGAISLKRKRELAAKVAKLQQAVKVARGEANSIEVADQKIGAEIFDYLGWGVAAE